MADQNVVLLSSIIEDRSESGIVRLSLSGDPEAAAVCDAVIYDYSEVTGTRRPTDEELIARKGEKVTVIRAGESMFGAGSVVATPGTIFVGTGGMPALLPRGSRKNGIKLKNVLDIVPGYDGVDTLRERVEQVRATFPEVTKLTQEDLDSLGYDDENRAPCKLAVFGTWQGPDEKSPGAIWLLDGYMKDEDIAEGVLIIRGEHGVSEHGSTYGKHLLRFGGKVVNFGGMGFKEALDLTDLDYHEALARITNPQTGISNPQTGEDVEETLF